MLFEDCKSALGNRRIANPTEQEASDTHPSPPQGRELDMPCKVDGVVKGGSSANLLDGYVRQFSSSKG